MESMLRLLYLLQNDLNFLRLLWLVYYNYLTNSPIELAKPYDIMSINDIVLVTYYSRKPGYGSILINYNYLLLL